MKTFSQFPILNSQFSILLWVLLFLGCHGGGGFQDMAYVKQAQRELRRLRNALEEYKVDKGKYPEEKSDLKSELAPYLSKFVYSEGKEIARYSGKVLGARNNLNQIRSALSGCARIQDAEIELIFVSIQNILEDYEKLLNGGNIKFISILSEVSKLQSAINNFNPVELKKSVNDSIIQEGQQIIAMVSSLLSGEPVSDDSVAGNEQLKNVKKTFERYNSELKGEKIDKQEELYSPESEIATFMETNVGNRYICSLQTLIGKHREYEGRKDYYEFLYTTINDLDRLKKLIATFEEKMKEVPEASKIMAAQTTLHRMADALKDYKIEFKKFPSQNANIDSILHSYFIEVTMSGDTIDRWEDALSWFSERPVYEVQDEERGFKLKAKVKYQVSNIKYQVSSLSGEVVLQNKWDEIVSVFSSEPIYATNDPLSTYFIKARARDSGGSWVTDRPPVAGKGD